MKSDNNVPFQIFSLKWVIPIILIICYIVIIYYPISPDFRDVPQRDSGVFLYIGERILNGDLPYLSVWDHKGPLLYYINAFGLFLSSNSWWGVWIFEFFLVTCAAIVGYIAILRIFGFFPAFFSSICWLTLLFFFLQGGNLTGEYALIFIFLSLLLIYIIEIQDSKKYKLGFFLIGLLLGCIFQLKPNFVGLFTALVVYLLFNYFKTKNYQYLLKISKLFLGYFFVFFITCGILYLQGNLFSYFDQYLVYNFIYASDNSFEQMFWNFQHFVSSLSAFNLQWIIIISYIATLFYYRYIERCKPINKILLIMIIYLPIELVFVSLPRSYIHYYLTFLPIIALFIGFFIFVMQSSMQKIMEFYSISKNTEKIIHIITLIIVAGICINPYIPLLILLQFNDCTKIALNNEESINQTYTNPYINFEEVSFNQINGGKRIFELSSIRSNQISPIYADVKTKTIDYIINNSDSHDYVLILGAEAGINFLSKRKSPSKYVYQYPLFKKGYGDEEMMQEFLSEIYVFNPKLIIQTDNPNTPFDNIEEILSNYSFVKRIVVGKTEWKIYERAHVLQ